LLKKHVFSYTHENGSNLLTFTPQTAAPVPALANLTMVIGNPILATWGVEGSTTDLRDVMATVYLDGGRCI
jgi:hypothetical protein